MKNVQLVEVFLRNVLVGKIALTDRGLCAFEYSAVFLQSGFSISPFELPLQSGVFIARPHPFNGNFGVFDDCLPDGWGMIILERFLQKQGIQPRACTILDKLSLVGSSGRGALEFRPDQSFVDTNEFHDFNLIASESAKILTSHTYQGAAIDDLYRRGGSPGGARPKIFIQHDNKEWLVKFRAAYDPVEMGQIEYKYSLLAKKCGIEMPQTRLFEGRYFGVERFDRSTAGKIHVVSAAGLLNADYRTPCIDYFALFQLCNLLTRNAQEMWKVYRLMVFNFLIGNKDDHAKNFAFLHCDNEWKFAPAFDVLPSDGINGYHTTTINDKAAPTKDDLIAVAQKAGLDSAKAISVFDEIHSILTHA
ncbi:MAG: type II toxin-antitoxin system HipA family toxin [Paludibacter sp.]